MKKKIEKNVERQNDLKSDAQESSQKQLIERSKLAKVLFSVDDVYNKLHPTAEQVKQGLLPK